MTRIVVIVSVLCSCALVEGQKLLFAQMLWRHGLRTPIDTYANDPYNEAFFGVPDGELLPHGMEQHFIRGQQLRQRYVDDLGLLSGKYSRYETYVRSGDLPRCLQSALSNMAGFFDGSPTFPVDVDGWPSAWTPIPIHTEPHDEDYILEAFDICPKYTALEVAREVRQEFQDFVASNWRLLHTINANSGNPEDYTFYAIAKMYQSLSIELSCNLTLPDWATDEFYSELQAAYFKGSDYVTGEAGFGLPLDKEIPRRSSGFLLNEWMSNIDDVINNSTTLKYYVYSGHDTQVNGILIGLGMKQELVGPDNCDYASTIVCELWEKDDQHYVKLLFSPNIDRGFTAFTSKLAGCGGDLCLLEDFQKVIQPLIATDTKICSA